MLKEEIEFNRGYSRIVEYSLDEPNLQLEQVMEYGRELGIDGYSPSVGNSESMPNGNRISSNSNIITDDYKYIYVTEVDGSGNVVFQAIVRNHSDKSSYRTIRMTLYPE
jgi:hypothetical protein